MARRLTPTQVAIVRNLADVGHPHGPHGRPTGLSEHGGWAGALHALVRKGLVDDKTHALTDAGKAEADRHG